MICIEINESILKIMKLIHKNISHHSNCFIRPKPKKKHNNLLKSFSKKEKKPNKKSNIKNESNFHLT